MADFAPTLRELAQERSRATGQVRMLDKAIAVLRKLANGTSVFVGRKPVRKKRTMSATARRKIAVAQRARWAKWKAAHRKKAP